MAHRSPQFVSNPRPLAGLLCAAVIGCGPGADPGSSKTRPVATAAPAQATAPEAATKAVTPPGTAVTPTPPVTPPTTPTPATPTPAVDAVAAGPLRPQEPGAYRPCEIEVASCTKESKPCPADESCAVQLVRLIPEGEPLEYNLTGLGTRSWRYAADGRVLSGPDAVYEHTGPTSGFRVREGKRTPVKFDAQGRLIQIGTDYRLEYTPDGRAAGHSSRTKGGKWERKLTVGWYENQRFDVSWTYSDADEYCDPSPETVEVDAQGRVVREVFRSCNINYSSFDLRYQYDTANRPVGLDIECEPEQANPSTWHLALKYECP